MLKKYWTLFQISWQSGLAYPLSMLLWRFRQVLTTIMSLTVWSVIYSQQSNVFGYDRNQMIGYVFLISLLQGMILATSLHSLAGDIYSGTISQLLIKPISVLRFLAIQDLADKLKNVGFIVFETIGLYLLFKPDLIFPNIWILGLFVVWTLLAVAMHFFIEILFGSMGFWSPQSWGPKFLFFMIIDATAGKLFPLDILPNIIQKGLALTPFPYLSYAQTQLFLGRLSSSDMVINTIGLSFWVIILGAATRYVWQRGVHSYDSAGN